MPSIPERIMKLEGDYERMRTDLDESRLVQKSHEKVLVDIATDKARVLTGAWVANGLTVAFFAVFMWLAQRTLASESALFKQSLIEEMTKRISTPVQGPVRR